MERDKMNYCKDCNVFVDECLQHCPLCSKKLTDTPAQNEMYPDVTHKKYIDRKNLTLDYLALGTFLIIGLCVVINVLTWNGIPWFLAASAPVLYAWVLVKLTIFSTRFVGIKVLIQMLALVGMFMAFDFVSGGTGWSYNYILPLVLGIGIAYMDSYSYFHKSYWRGNLLYAILFVALGFIPLIFYVTGVSHAFFPTFLSTFASGITILGICRFALRYFKLEMKKRFHM
ncbi:MAG: DUF6320 domain-containing protein [Christensenellaceae bacterium]